MDINYKLKENDYLQLNLYLAKEEGHVRKDIIRSTIIWFIILSVISIFAYRGLEDPFSYFFPLATVLSLVFSPSRTKENLFKSYKKSIKVYKNEFDKNVHLKIDDEHIYQTTIDTEVKLKISTIELIIETGSYFYIKSSTRYIIIPKNEVQDVNQVKQNLKALSEKLNITYKTNLDWKW